MANPMFWRIVLVGAAILFLPLVVSGTTALVTTIIESFGREAHSLLRPITRSGSARLEDVVRLCLYLIAILGITRMLFRKR